MGRLAPPLGTSSFADALNYWRSRAVEVRSYRNTFSVPVSTAPARVLQVFQSTLLHQWPVL